jgi:hypothetical protein
MRYLARVLDEKRPAASALYEVSDNLRMLWRMENAIKYAEIGAAECVVAAREGLTAFDIEHCLLLGAEFNKLLGWEYTAISRFGDALDAFRKSY